MRRAFVLMAFAVIISACSANSLAGPNVWARDQAVGVFEAQGLTGSESPLADGTPRWLGRAGSSSAEVIGAAGAVKAVSLTTIVDGAGGKLMGTTLGAFLPDSPQWVTDQLTAHQGVNIDTSREFL